MGSFVADMAIKKCLSSDPQKHSFISKAGEKKKKERTFDEIWFNEAVASICIQIEEQPQRFKGTFNLRLTALFTAFIV